MFKKTEELSVNIKAQCSCKCSDACGDTSAQGTKLNGKAK